MKVTFLGRSADDGGTFFGEENPLGRQIEAKKLDERVQPARDIFFQVIGVMRDTKDYGPQVPVLPMAFVPYTIRVRTTSCESFPFAFLHLNCLHTWPMENSYWRNLPFYSRVFFLQPRRTGNCRRYLQRLPPNK